MAIGSRDRLGSAKQKVSRIRKTQIELYSHSARHSRSRSLVGIKAKDRGGPRQVSCGTYPRSLHRVSLQTVWIVPPLWVRSEHFFFLFPSIPRRARQPLRAFAIRSNRGRRVARLLSCVQRSVFIRSSSRVSTRPSINSQSDYKFRVPSVNPSFRPVPECCCATILSSTVHWPSSAMRAGVCSLSFGLNSFGSFRDTL